MTESDPHFAVGVSQGRLALEPYRWQNAEHQRRYDLGYQYGAETRDRLTATRTLSPLSPLQQAIDSAALYRQLQRLAGGSRTP